MAFTHFLYIKLPPTKNYKSTLRDVREIQIILQQYSAVRTILAIYGNDTKIKCSLDLQICAPKLISVSPRYVFPSRCFFTQLDHTLGCSVLIILFQVYAPSNINQS